MARGLYKLDITLTAYPPDDGAVADVVEIGRGTKWAYLYSARCPNAALKALGAELVGEGWTGVWRAITSTERGKIFEAEWEETEIDPDDPLTPMTVRRRGKLKDKPGGVAGKPAKLREVIIPISFGERERDADQRALDRETRKGG